jgi:uncharacterized protein involved in exopolysaccharide biosynthesis
MVSSHLMIRPMLVRFLLPPDLEAPETIGLEVVLRCKAMIASWLSIGALAGAVAFALTPPSFQTRASFIVEQRVSSRGASGALGSLASELGVGVGPGAASAQYFADLLRSRAVQSAVAHRSFRRGNDSLQVSAILGTAKETERATEEATISEIDLRLNVSANSRTGVVSLDFTSGHAGDAANITRALLDELEKFVREKRKSSAREQAQFARKTLLEAEDALRAAEENEMIFTDRNREWQASPRLTLIYQQLHRRTVSQQALVTSLQSQLETAKMEEVNDIPQITVLDEPVPSAGRSAPRLSSNLGLGILCGFLAAAILLALRIVPRPLNGSDPGI